MSEHVRRVAIFFDAQEEPAGIQLLLSGDACDMVRTVLGRSTPEPTFGMMMLTVKQAGALGTWAGRLSFNSSPNYEISHAFYDVLCGGFFNCFWDDGVDGYLRGERSMR